VPDDPLAVAHGVAGYAGPLAYDAPMTPRAPEGDWLGTPHLRFERSGAIATVVVDRPEARNALTPAMYFGIRYAIDHVNRDASLAGLLLTGTGDVFIPGGDMGGSTEDGWTDLPQYLGMDITPFEAVRRSPKPIMCAVNGLAQGGGLMIAMLSDVAVASDRATFRAPELLRGIADTNYAQVLPRQIGPARARDMLLTGRLVTAAEAEAWGLVARVVAHDRLLAEATEVLEAACRTAPGARHTVKRTLHEYYGHYDRMGMDESLAGDEFVEGYRAFKEDRPPSWVPESLRRPGRL
jgi:enoyl-CoA hydratase